jgi:hypothetical protein
MKYKEFIKNVEFGSTTAFVYDSPNNRYVYSSGEITESTFENITDETEFEIVCINKLPEVKEVIVDNFLSELEPAQGVEDDGYNEVKKRLETGDAKIGYWSENDGNDDIYMLIF